MCRVMPRHAAVLATDWQHVGAQPRIVPPSRARRSARRLLDSAPSRWSTPRRTTPASSGSWISRLVHRARARISSAALSSSDGIATAKPLSVTLTDAETPLGKSGQSAISASASPPPTRRCDRRTCASRASTPGSRAGLTPDGRDQLVATVLAREILADQAAASGAVLEAEIAATPANAPGRAPPDPADAASS